MSSRRAIESSASLPIKALYILFLRCINQYPFHILSVFG